ncbi:CTD kinase subunit gamma CTK3-domain-containing protein [Naematelia encephala]|uniref:CTD kinase subunit gamma CTK3-domain-containing protein n=1 Tax=Naematelia encephala TaxID=71784 RepID=A0A1Y2AUN8_9TREE|nr:CTD kinase subunit gamma CTK3-domain-containing protein [Naematelia encephala]
MSFDPFEARLQFLQLLRKLNASQASIQKVVSYAVKYGSRCGEDLWECIMEECAKGTLNSRINVLYFLDTLAETSTSIGPPDAPYLAFMRRDLATVVSHVVPPSREGILNLKATRQILESWRTRRILDQGAGVVEAALAQLDNRGEEDSSPNVKRKHEEAFSKQEIIRRMEEDRERHKRLREKIWILPIPALIPPNRQPLPQLASTVSQSSPSTVSPFTPASPSNRAKMMPPPPPPPAAAAAPPSTGQTALQVEFEQAWEGTGPASEIDLERYRAEAKLAGIHIDS